MIHTSLFNEIKCGWNWERNDYDINYYSDRNYDNLANKSTIEYFEI